MNIERNPAFPQSVFNECETHYFGMTLRDYFAAKALNSILLQDEIGIQANRPTGHYDAGVDETCAELWARNAYEIADAMLKVRDAG